MGSSTSKYKYSKDVIVQCLSCENNQILKPRNKYYPLVYWVCKYCDSVNKVPRDVYN